MNAHRKISHGFTILEMAIVLLVIAVLTASMVGPLTNYLYQRQVADTQKSLEEIKEALLGYAAAKGYLPRPAKSASDGIEKMGCAPSEADCSGFVPWETLGTPRVDAWGKIFQYSVSPEYTGAQVKFTAAATKNICAVYDTTTAKCAQTLASNVPVLVWSVGRRNWGTDASGVDLPNLGVNNTDETVNQTVRTAGTLHVISRTYSEAGAVGGEFDDQVVWLSAPLLFNRMLSAGQKLD